MNVFHGRSVDGIDENASIEEEFDFKRKHFVWIIACHTVLM